MRKRIINSDHLYRFTKVLLLPFFLFYLTSCDAPPDVEETPIVPGETELTMQEETLEDDEILRAIDEELNSTRGAMNAEVDVEVRDGFVILNGTVPHLLARDRIEEITSRVRGVRSIVNNIDVNAADRNDAVIEADIATALAESPVTERWEVFADVNDGVVELTGTVESMQESMHTEQVVKRIKGIVGVRNNLTISFGEERTDSEIAEDIERAYLWDVQLDDGLVTVEVNDGVVRLSGMVGSVAEKNQAETLAWVIGVQGVESENLTIGSWAREDMLRTSWMAEQTDADKREAIETAYRLDPRVNSYDVKVDVVEGVAMLTGDVYDIKSKRVAAEIASNTFGVWSVENNLEINPHRSFSDAEVAQSVQNALERDILTQPESIQYEVDNGVVTLNGTVDSYFGQRHYEDVIAGVVSVEEIVNNLNVNAAYLVDYYPPYLYNWNPNRALILDRNSDQPVLSDAELLVAVNDELFWTPYVNDQAITVTVQEGIVTLTGTVSTPYVERHAVAEAHEAGATGVVNNLEIDYDYNLMYPGLMNITALY